MEIKREDGFPKSGSWFSLGGHPMSLLVHTLFDPDPPGAFKKDCGLNLFVPNQSVGVLLFPVFLVVVPVFFWSPSSLLS